jgi:hypothetical protein
MSSPVTAGTRVVTAGSPTSPSAAGRTGVAVYDFGAAYADTQPSVIVIFADGTYGEYPRGSITQISGGWIPGIGI